MWAARHCITHLLVLLANYFYNKLNYNLNSLIRCLPAYPLTHTRTLEWNIYFAREGSALVDIRPSNFHACECASHKLDFN